MPIGKLQRSTIAQIPVSPPSSTKHILWDTTIRGFGAYRTSDGNVSFLYQYRMTGGKTKSTRLGILGEMTIEQARNMAAGLALQRRQGIDPILERRRLLQIERDKAELTIAAYAEDYLQRRIDDERPVNKAQAGIIRKDVIGKLGTIRLDEMRVDDVEQFARQLAERGRSVKRTGLAVLKMVLNDAVDRDRIVKSPARSIKLPKGGERFRRLREDEMQRFIEAAREVGGPRGDVCELLLRLCKRREEIAQMTWETIDLVKREWTLPDSANKGAEPFIIELPRQAYDIVLRQQPDPKLRTGPVFTMDGGGTSPSMDTQVKDMLDAYMHRRLELANKRDGTALKVGHFTLHDLRTTVTSRLEEKPFIMQPSVLDALLLHKKPGRGSLAIYARAKLGKEAGEALVVWNDYLDGIMDRDDAFPGGVTLPRMRPAERIRRIAEFREGWPMTATQQKAKDQLLEQGIDTVEFRRRQRRQRIINAKLAGRTSAQSPA